MIKNILILSVLFFTPLSHANFLDELGKDWIKSRKESSRKSCEKRNSAETVALIDSILSNKDPQKQMIIATKGENPQGWYTVYGKESLKILCHDSRLSQYVTLNKLIPIGLRRSVFYCGYQVYSCNFEKEGRGDDRDLSWQVPPPASGPVTDDGGTDDGGTDDGGTDDGGTDDGGTDDGGTDDGGTDDGGTDDGGTDDGGTDDGGGQIPDNF